MEKICGIYKITSPTKKVYIGQSVDIKKRLKSYKYKKTTNRQTLLERSFQKYGYDNHTFEIIHTCKSEELNDLEIHYIKFFNSFGGGLNLKSGGQKGGMCSEETRAKLRKPKTDEQKENYRKAALNRPPVSEVTREKHRKRMLGNTNLKGKKAWLGKTHSEETKAILREKRKSQVMPKGYKRAEFSEEWKNNMSKSKMGNTNKKNKNG